MILCPALLLAGFGLVSLRQDRILAEHQAREEAAVVADEVVRELSSLFEVPDFGQRDNGRAADLGSADPLWHLARRVPSVAWLTGADGELLFPRPVRSLAHRERLPIETLSADQTDLWASANEGFFTAGAVEVYRGLWESFLKSEPPRRFAGLAHFRAGALEAARGTEAGARAAWEKVAAEFGDVPGETGLPLGVCAYLRLLRLPSRAERAAQRLEWIQAAAAGSVLEPTSASGYFLDQLRKLASEETRPEALRVVEVWTEVLSLHAIARVFHEAFTGSEIESAVPAEKRTSRWVKGEDGEFLVVRVPAGAEAVCNWAVPERSVHSLVRKAASIKTLREYLGLQIEVGGRVMLDSPEAGAAVLASTRADPAGLKVAIVLADPAGLYGRQRTRTVLFGTLLALATAAVGAGFWAARRAFWRQQQLSELKSNFVSSVSHEMRAPIASVRLMAEELEDLGVWDREKSKEYHRFIVQECRRLSGLIENVLDFSRQEQGRQEYEFEPVDFSALVENTIEKMRVSAAAKSVALETAQEGAPLPVDADISAIQQLLVNLVDNAIKHSPTGGAVRIEWTFPPAGADRGTIEVIQLRVRDNGPGIPPEDQERVFERFYRRGSELRRETQGIGLGLAIVRNVAEAHGGRVWVESAVGAGSCFRVELPIQQTEI